MAFNPSPTGYFPSITILASGDASPNSGVFIGFSDLDTYSVSTTGDVRELIYSFVEAVSDTYLNLATADKPTQVSITRTASVPSDNVIRKTYSITVNLQVENVSVVSE